MCMAQSMFFAGNDPAALQISEQMVDLGRELRTVTSRPWDA